MSYLEKEGFKKDSVLRKELGFSAYAWREMEAEPGFPPAFRITERGDKYRRLSDVIAWIDGKTKPAA